MIIAGMQVNMKSESNESKKPQDPKSFVKSLRVYQREESKNNTTHIYCYEYTVYYIGETKLRMLYGFWVYFFGFWGFFGGFPSPSPAHFWSSKKELKKKNQVQGKT